MTKSIIKHVTPLDGNVFIDLGFPREEAVALLAESNRIIAEKVAIKETPITEAQPVDRPDGPEPG